MLSISRHSRIAGCLATIFKNSLGQIYRSTAAATVSLPVVSLSPLLRSIVHRRGFGVSVTALGHVGQCASVSISRGSGGRVISKNSLETIVALVKSEGRKTITKISKSILTWSGIVFNSTLKKRRSKIKKHKLKKRRKGLRFNTKLSRQ